MGGGKSKGRQTSKQAVGEGRASSGEDSDEVEYEPWERLDLSIR